MFFFFWIYISFANVLSERQKNRQFYLQARQTKVPPQTLHKVAARNVTMLIYVAFLSTFSSGGDSITASYFEPVHIIWPRYLAI